MAFDICLGRHRIAGQKMGCELRLYLWSRLGLTPADADAIVATAMRALAR
jgi:hypothetical protein